MFRSTTGVTRASRALAFAAGLAAPVALAGAAAPAFTVRTLISENFGVPGYGSVTFIDNLAVNNCGTYALQLTTNNPTPGTRSVVYKNETLYQTGETPVPALANSTFGTPNGFTIDRAGNLGWNFTGLSGLTSATDSGIFFNQTLALQEGSTLLNPAAAVPPLPAETSYIGFFPVEINDNRQYAVIASLTYPGNSVVRALVRLTVDASGARVGEQLLAFEGSELLVSGGGTRVVEELGTNRETYAINNAGDIVYIADFTGDTATDTAVYKNQTLLAQEGQQAFNEGPNWSSLGSAKVALNNCGSVAILGSLNTGVTATNQGIVKDGVKFIQKGDQITVRGTAVTLTGFGTGPVELTDRGDIVWAGTWLDGTATRKGLFRNRDLLVATDGQTVIDNVVLNDLYAIESGYRVSDNGDYIIFRGLLPGSGQDASFLLSFASPDWNRDCAVSSADITAFLSTWFADRAATPQTTNADFDANGSTSSADITAFLSAWFAARAGC